MATRDGSWHFDCRPWFVASLKEDSFFYVKKESSFFILQKNDCRQNLYSVYGLELRKDQWQGVLVWKKIKSCSKANWKNGKTTQNILFQIIQSLWGSGAKKWAFKIGKGDHGIKPQSMVGVRKRTRMASNCSKPSGKSYWLSGLCQSTIKSWGKWFEDLHAPFGCSMASVEKWRSNAGGCDDRKQQECVVAMSVRAWMASQSYSTGAKNVGMPLL